VRQREKDHVNVAGENGVRVTKDHRRIGRGEGGHEVTNSFPGVGLTRGEHDLKVGVRRAESKYL
jgi:hypothetical protein